MAPNNEPGVKEGSITSTIYAQLFFCPDHKRAKKTDSFTVLIALLGSMCLKAAQIMLVKLNPGVNFINIKRTNFTYECLFLG
jgi:hypothetical protein